MAGDEKWLSAAECAKRTGLTVRALRVYEREGLLRPSRSSKGWRQFGAKELARLNMIVSLKALGLSLARIRGLLTENSTSLSQVLHMQCESLRRTVAESEYALSMATVAAKRLLTPEEQHAWDMWWAMHPKDAAQNAAFLRERIKIHEEIHGLLQRGVEPSAPAAQQLMTRYNMLLEKYGVRERTVRTRDWNEAVTTRFMAIEAVARARELKSDHLPHPFASQKLLNFIDTARAASTWSVKLRQLLGDVNRLIHPGTKPDARVADTILQRLRALCARYDLGDAYVYARYTLFLAHINQSKMSPGHERAWDYLVRALEMRQRKARAPQRSERGKRLRVYPLSKKDPSCTN